MNKDRRMFLVSAGMAAGATMIGTGAGREVAGRSSDSVDDVLRVVSRYGEVVSRSKDQRGVTRIRVGRINHPRMLRALSQAHGPSFDRILVTSQNRLEVTHRGDRIIVSHQA